MIKTFVRHIKFLLRWNYLSLRSRMRPAIVMVLGFAGVVSVFVSVLSIQEGFKFAAEATGNSNLAVVLRKGSKTELGSLLNQSDVNVIRSIVSDNSSNTSENQAAELLLVVNIPQKTSNIEATVPLRGVESSAMSLRNSVELVEGRMFSEGLNEIIIGRGVADRYVGMSIGDVTQWGRYKWTVVGIFEAGGSVYESEIWSDGNVLKSAYDRGNNYQSAYFKIESDIQFNRVKDLLESDDRLSVVVYKESEYYKAQSKFQEQFISTVGTAISILMAVGAVFGAINMMHSTIAARGREIGVLRAIGFNRFSVLLVIMLESVLLGLVGGVLGGALTWLVLNGYQTSMANIESFSQVVFAFSVTPELLKTGLLIALVMGLVGGLPPAFSAARSSVVDLVRNR